MMRNLFGQVDGSVNRAPATDDFTSLVWNEDGSTTMVIRRIHMDVNTWDEVDRFGREFSVGCCARVSVFVASRWFRTTQQAMRPFAVR